ncbi:uncharacterized protein JN550_012692 [Neoarthrinium moseri]|uniref:uncharacterized protein n=1 Tax=Neoarthrinium moseri TaxID=1658444 RepID=UPI001FDE21BD|nr:uncharacterized protein JN550_012692 [Neoarthrinium moseri]KAI1858408.1 hypothetical protein JN550_012692 [Neoarthrinium moseri]
MAGSEKPSGTPGFQPTTGPIRKRRRGSERCRVTRACDRCKRRKVRCNGTHPCEHCTEAATRCTYDASYTRGRPPYPVATGPSTTDSTCTANTLGRTNTSHIDQPVSAARVDKGVPTTLGADGLSHGSQEHQGRHLSSSLDPASIENPPIAPSLRVSPEPGQTDLQGHYVGPASGVSFLLRVQKRFHQAVSFSQASSIFTFGDAPLPESDPAFCVLLSRDEAQRLLDRYFDFAVATHRFLHRPTLQCWLDEFFATKGSMSHKEDAPVRKAALFMVFAQVREYMPESNPTAYTYDHSSSFFGAQTSAAEEQERATSESAQFFNAAEQQLSKERGSVRLTSVQVRLAQCFYLLMQSRINHCWSLFGTTAHLALAIGLNRNRRAHPTSEHNRVEIECRRRTFWCAYSLDNYLSAVLGRPRTLHDDDIDQELPSVIEDSDLVGENNLAHRANRTQSLMMACVAHVKISRIVSMILRDLYSIRPLSVSTRITLTAQHTNSLKHWRDELSHFLDAKGINASLLLPIYQRQRNVLNHAYWHAMILTNRPFLLSNFARLQHSGTLPTENLHKAEIDTCVQDCLNAALNMVESFDNLFQADQVSRAFWFTIYFSFSAVVVLYVYVIQQKSSPPDVYQKYLEAADTCQTQILSVAAKGSLTQRYCLVLEELRREAWRQTTGLEVPVVFDPQSMREHSPPVTSQPLPTVAIGGEMAEPAVQYPDLAIPGDFINWNASPSSSLADITSWGQFDSMVTSGFSGLEALLGTESTGPLYRTAP